VKLKRVLASILCVAMVLSTMGTVAFAEDETVAHLASTGDTFTTLQAAFDAVKTMDGENQIVMDKNVTENLVLDGTGYSLYMNGYTLTGQIKIVSGGLTLRGHGTSVPSTRGKIVASGTDESTYPIYCVSDYTNSAHVYLSQVDIEASDANGTAIYMDSSALDVQLMSDVAVTGNVQVNDGTFVVNSADEESINKVNGAIVKNAPGAVDIKGGLFSEDPSDLLVAGFKAEQTSEGWEVVTESLAQTIEDFEKDAEGAYLIKTADEMVVFHTELSAGGAATFSGKVFKIANDIDLSGKTFVTTGNKNNRFAGTLDGQNYTLSNLTVDGAGKDYAAFIGSLAAEGTVKNIKVKNATVTGATYTAVLVGQSRATSSIENCHVSGDINVTATGSFVAGIVGGAQNAGVNDCSVSGTGTISGSYAVGGIIGIVSEGMESINNNSVSGISVTGGQRVGGIAGSVLVAAAGLEVKNNAVENVTVSSDTSDAGLIIGQYNKVVGQVKVAENTAVESSATEAGVPVTNLYGDNLAVDYVTYVAKVGGEYYTDLKEAVKAMTAENNELNILDNITVDYKWDCRPVSKGGTGATFTFPVVINGNNNTIKFTGEINDGFNHLAVFRPEAEATFMNLTVDMSEAISVFQNRFSVISSKDANLTVENCNFIGSETYTNARAIIFGETADNNDAEIVVSGCTFTNFRYGVTDNLNGKDVASVEVTGSEFSNASINVSASEEVVITDNVVDGGFVKVTSYTQSPEQNLTVTVTGNTLDEDFAADNQIQAGTVINAQDGFITPVVDADGVKYVSLQTAINKVPAGATITLLEDISLTAQDAQTFFKPAYNRESYAGLIIPDDKTITINLNGKTISYVDEHYDVDNVGILNLGNLTINDSVAFARNSSAGGKITYKPVAGSSTYSKFYSTIFNCGTLTVNGGTIENTAEAETDVTNAVDNHSRLSHEYGNDCILTVNGGHLTGAYYYAIRQYTHYFEGVKNRVTINNGTIEGGIYMQHGDSWYYANPGQNRLNVDGYLTINGGNFIATSTDNFNTIKSRLSNPDNNAWGLEINGGTFNDAVVQLLVQKGYRYSEDGTATSGTLITGEAAGTRNTEWLEENGGFISGGTFTDIGSADDVTTNLQSFLAEGVELQRTGADLYTVLAADSESDKLTADTISIEYKDVTVVGTEGEKTYEVIVKANEDDKINELASVDLTFVYTSAPITGGNIDFTVAPADKFAMTRYENTNRYMFNYNGVDAYEGTDSAITVANITVTGYGEYTIKTADVATNIVNATTVKDSLVDSYTAAGATDDDSTTGGLVINTDSVAGDDMVGEVTDGNIAVPVRTLTINLDFPNAVEDNKIAYQDMKVEITGTIDGVNKTVVYNLGEDEVAMANGDYVVEEDRLVLNNAYTVTVSGAGYRTARYTVTMTEDKVLKFWNNVMDEKQFVEIGKESSKVNVTFLAGDIVKDNKINIYDLSAVVSYFGTETNTAAYDAYAKYDLNRDGVIDSKDVAYVLVSWNN